MNSNLKKIIKISGLSVFFLLIVSYGFFVSKDFIFGVRIRNVNLQDGATVADNIINLTGNAKNAVKLSLNGREISVDQQGNFAETIALLEGYNIISVRAQDKFGNSDEKNYQLIYKQ
ncbi:MAG: hypothetical protein WAN61_00175 [Minisyncoccia bacterium]